MAPMSDHPGERTVTHGDDPEAGAETPPEDESPADPPPLNRAERRLEAKRKKGRGKSGRTAQQRPGRSGGAMRGRGLQGFARSRKGTNTRRSG